MAESKSAALPLGYAPTAGPEAAGLKPCADSLWHRRSIGGGGSFQPAGGPNFGKQGAGCLAMHNNGFHEAFSGTDSACSRRQRVALPRLPRRPELRPWRFRGKTAVRHLKCRSEIMVMTYRAPINDMLLALNHGAGLQAAVKAGHYGDFDGDITAAVLEEAGKFAADVLAPLNRVGDENGIKGTKIFITYGDHDMTDNIVHFVLARLPDAPAGTKGISLFLIPKFLVI